MTDIRTEIIAYRTAVDTVITSAPLAQPLSEHEASRTQQECTKVILDSHEEVSRLMNAILIKDQSDTFGELAVTQDEDGSVRAVRVLSILGVGNLAVGSIFKPDDEDDFGFFFASIIPPETPQGAIGVTVIDNDKVDPLRVAEFSVGSDQISPQIQARDAQRCAAVLRTLFGEANHAENASRYERR